MFTLQKKKYKTKTIIFASGGGIFEPIRLNNIPYNKYNNIDYSVNNVNKFINKELVIFGGGDSAIDWAHFFMNKSKKVTLIHRREEFRAQEKMLNEVKKTCRILTPYKLKEIIGEKKIEKMIIVDIKNKREQIIKCDEVLVKKKKKKTVDKDFDFNLEMKRNSIIVKSNMESSREGIFAVGNVAYYEGKINMLVTAFGESATAVGSVVSKVFPGKKMSYYVKKKEN